jgi:hypothetical protein
MDIIIYLIDFFNSGLNMEKFWFGNWVFLLNNFRCGILGDIYKFFGLNIEKLKLGIEPFFKKFINFHFINHFFKVFKRNFIIFIIVKEIKSEFSNGIPSFSMIKISIFPIIILRVMLIFDNKKFILFIIIIRGNFIIFLIFRNFQC